MSANVDVLSVLDQAIERERQAGQATVAQIAARAAVAELIDAATDVWHDTLGATTDGKGERLRAALANIGPQS